MAEFGIRGEPQPADVLRLVDLVAQRPALEARIHRAADELMLTLPLSPELRHGLESRHGLSLVSDRLIAQLMDWIDIFEAIDAYEKINGIDVLQAENVQPRSAQAYAATVSMSPPRGAMSGMEAGPSSRPPRGESFANTLTELGILGQPQPADIFRLLDLVAQHPDLEARIHAVADDLLASLDISPALRNRLQSRFGRDLVQDRLVMRFLDAMNRCELAALGIHGEEPQPADIFGLVDLVAQRPDLEARIHGVVDDLLASLDVSPELRNGVQSRHGRSPVSDRLIARLIDTMNSFEENFSGDESDEIDGLEDDLNQQHDPLGSEIQAWVRLTGEPLDTMHAFDDEENAPSFARMLARLRGSGSQGTSAPPEQTAAQVSSVIHAIANDAGLRTQVFSIAQDALGSCGDNLAEGFSKIRLAVDKHQMAQAVAHGQVNAKQLNDWAGSLFRLSLLESAVHRFIHTQLQRSDLPELQRNALTNEPLETMVHAKVALREMLGLPMSTVSEIRFRRCSVLRQRDLDMLAQQVKIQGDDGQEHGKFLLGLETWRAGMKVLHAQHFKDLKAKQDNDPFFDLDVPTDLVGQAAYAAQARRVEAKFADEENALLLRLAAERG